MCLERKICVVDVGWAAEVDLHVYRLAFISNHLFSFSFFAVYYLFMNVKEYSLEILTNPHGLQRHIGYHIKDKNPIIVMCWAFSLNDFTKMRVELLMSQWHYSISGIEISPVRLLLWVLYLQCEWAKYGCLLVHRDLPPEEQKSSLYC